MPGKNQLIDILQKHQHEFHAVVPFDALKNKLLSLDFSENNKELTDEILSDTNKFSAYIHHTLQRANCKYGIGGYAEHRTVYSRSKHFDSLTPGEEPRRLHLGIDIWGAVNTPVIAPLHGIIHSFAFNNHFGDYGATIILTHNIEGITFHTLYGHLSLNSLKNLQEGRLIKRGDVFAEFGMQFENGHWPPHLHFQLIIDMQEKKGDYPGVCKYSERESYLDNCPDPDIMLSMIKFSEHE
ncbi:MAG: peptidoglycan DD-metalloendopeptidase family protein [Bacteroidota bacterium]